jgi:hypothetical protein
MAQSVHDTGEADVYAYIDEDWEGEYAGTEGVKCFVGPRVGPVRSANRLVRKVPEHAAYGLLTDDATVLTPGWDRWVLDAISKCPGRICVVAPCHNMGNMVDMPFVSREWIEVTGWYACPVVHHWCWPTVTALIGEMTAIVHAPKASFELFHDAEFHSSNTDMRDEDNRKFFEFVSLKLPRIVERMRQAMYEPAIARSG